MLGNIVSGGDQEEKRNFINLISDSKQRMGYMEEMLRAEKAFNKAKAEAEKAQGQAKTDLANAEAASKKVSLARKDIEDRLALLKTAEDTFEDEKKAYITATSTEIARMEARDSQQNQRDQGLKQRESQVSAREKAVGAKEKKIEAEQAAWMDKKQQLDRIFA